MTRQTSLSSEGRKAPKLVLSREYVSDYDVLLATNDVLEFLDGVPSDTFQLIVTSPPYNIGKPYEERKAFGDYLVWQKETIKECIRVLKKGGSLCWQVGNYVENGEVFPLDAYFYSAIKENSEMLLRNRIVWFFEHGLHASRRLSKGKNPGDVWKVLQQDWEALMWDIPNVKSNHPEKTIHPAQFPIELVERLLLALTNEEDVVFDPFMGVGSALVAAVLHGRRAAGVDRESGYVKTAFERVQAALSGTLRYRPLGTAKHVPTGKEKVAQVPREWRR